MSEQETNTDPSPTSRVLLVVDDEPAIVSLLRRSLGYDFDRIHVAGRASDAESILAEHTVTHLVCDLYLGNDEPLGDELIRRWKRRWPTIRYAALFTGSTYEKGLTYEKVDNIFMKPRGYDDLIGLLRRRIV
jgi:DNA-binding NtrC family response regulator